MFVTKEDLKKQDKAKKVLRDEQLLEELIQLEAYQKAHPHGIPLLFMADVIHGSLTIFSLSFSL